jgi:formylmethanofuran dehydrogenase subunit C
MSGLVVEPRTALLPDTDFGAVLAGEWTSHPAEELAKRPVALPGRDEIRLGEICKVSGDPDGSVRFVGDFAPVLRLGAGLTEGRVVVEGRAGDEVGLGMAGGSIEVQGDAGDRAGAAAAEARRGMTGGELVIRGSVGNGAGALMRRGLLAVGGRVGTHAGAGMIAGTLVAFGDLGAAAGLWSKRGSIVALSQVPVPSTYRLACTYQPTHLRLLLIRLRSTYGLPVEGRHLTGFYRRYSGDLADLGKGEILVWTAP